MTNEQLEAIVGAILSLRLAMLDQASKSNQAANEVEKMIALIKIEDAKTASALNDYFADSGLPPLGLKAAQAYKDRADRIEKSTL